MGSSIGQHGMEMTAWHGIAWHRTPGSGTRWHGIACHGMSWHGTKTLANVKKISRIESN
jgi:hypothetical protein